MAFTTMSRIQLDQGNGGPAGVFYAEDIMMVMNQTDSNQRRVVGVEMHHAIIDGNIEGAVLIGVAADEEGNLIRLTSAPYVVAVKCPPSNHQGGVPLPLP